MLTTVIGSLITALIKVIPENLVRSALGAFLDHVEEKIIASPNKIDDCALPIIQCLRLQLLIGTKISVDASASSK